MEHVKPFNYSDDFVCNYIYDDLIHIIKVLPPSKKNKHFNIQWDGVGCRNSIVENGKIVETFSSDNKFFDRHFWYDNFTRWGRNYPSKIYMSKMSMPEPFKSLWDNIWKLLDDDDQEAIDKINDHIDEVSVPAVDVLNEIINEVKEKTGLDYEYGGKSTDYGDEWGEAFVPLRLNGEMYILTWENCD